MNIRSKSSKWWCEAQPIWVIVIFLVVFLNRKEDFERKKKEKTRSEKLARESSQVSRSRWKKGGSCNFKLWPTTRRFYSPAFVLIERNSVPILPGSRYHFNLSFSSYLLIHNFFMLPSCFIRNTRITILQKRKTYSWMFKQ